MLRYLEIFYRHRLVLFTPLVLTIFLSGAFAVSQPSVYQGTAKLWVDRNALGAAAPDNQYVSAAQEQAAVLQELIKTRSFSLKVGSRGPLAADLAKRSGSDLLNRAIRLARPAHVGSVSGVTLDDLVYTNLITKTTVLAAGPQIISIAFDYPDARVAGLTAGAIVDQFLDEVLSGRRAIVQASLSFYGQQTSSAESELALADSKVFNYLGAHPEQSRPGALPDGTLTELQRQDDFARQRYSGLLQKYEGAQLDSAAVKTAALSGFRVIDPAQVPLTPVSRLKLYLAAGAAGLGAGLLLLLVGVLAFTLADSSIRRPEEVEPALGLRVVGTIPELAA